jgi:hypothetical protein
MIAAALVAGCGISGGESLAPASTSTSRPQTTTTDAGPSSTTTTAASTTSSADVATTTSTFVPPVDVEPVEPLEPTETPPFDEPGAECPTGVVRVTFRPEVTSETTGDGDYSYTLFIPSVTVTAENLTTADVSMSSASVEDIGASGGYYSAGFYEDIAPGKRLSAEASSGMVEETRPEIRLDLRTADAFATWSRYEHTSCPDVEYEFRIDAGP